MRTAQRYAHPDSAAVRGGDRTLCGRRRTNDNLGDNK